MGGAENKCKNRKKLKEIPVKCYKYGRRFCKVSTSSESQTKSANLIGVLESQDQFVKSDAPLSRGVAAWERRSYTVSH